MHHITTLIVYLKEFNAVSVLVRLFLAVLLGGLVGLERSRSGRAAGLRTHILVCLGAAIASMTGLYINSIYDSGDVSRIAAQVISGIGFLGAGTILVKNKSTVTGLTTAACVWAVGTLGIAIGYGFYEAAIFGAFLIFFITKTLNAVDRKVRPNSKIYEVHIELADAKQINQTISDIKNMGIDVDVVNVSEAVTSIPNSISVNLWLHVHKNSNVQTIVNDINQLNNIHFAVLLMGG